jgi:FAD/FMN-containing dehydrogenase
VPESLVMQRALPWSPHSTHSAVHWCAFCTSHERRVVFTNFWNTPSAVVYARSAAEVAAAVTCGVKWSVRVSAASGRHSYLGQSVPDGMLVVDLSNMTHVSVGSRCHW